MLAQQNPVLNNTRLKSACPTTEFILPSPLHCLTFRQNLKEIFSDFLVALRPAWHWKCFPLHMLHGPLTRYVKLQVADVPGMPGTFSPPLLVSDPDMHHGMCVTHVPWCMSGSLTRAFLWSRRRGKSCRHCRRMHNPHFYVSDKRPIARGNRVHGFAGAGSWKIWTKSPIPRIPHEEIGDPTRPGLVLIRFRDKSVPGQSCSI